VEYINKIESERELIVVEKIVAEYNASELPEESVSADEEYEPDIYPQHGYSQDSSLTVLSSRTISGPVKSGAQFVSLLGSEHIKIRKSDLSGRRTVLNIVSILGESVVFVESGIRVSNKAIPILGGCWMDQNVGRQASQAAPELIISGAALLGNITVKLLPE